MTIEENLEVIKSGVEVVLKSSCFVNAKELASRIKESVEGLIANWDKLGSFEKLKIVSEIIRRAQIMETVPLEMGLRPTVLCIGKSATAVYNILDNERRKQCGQVFVS